MTASHSIEIDGHRLIGVVYRGEPYVIASQLATALGYEDPRALAQAISRDWADEFERGVEYIVVRGQELKELREVIEAAAGSTTTLSRFAPATLLLTRSGVDLACIKTNKPAGVELRRRLVRELFPALREGRLPGLEPERQPTVDDQRAVELLSKAAEHNARAAGLSEMAALQLVGEDRYRWLRKTLQPSSEVTRSVTTRDRAAVSLRHEAVAPQWVSVSEGADIAGVNCGSMSRASQAWPRKQRGKETLIPRVCVEHYARTRRRTAKTAALTAPPTRSLPAPTPPVPTPTPTPPKANVLTRAAELAQRLGPGWHFMSDIARAEGISRGHLGKLVKPLGLKGDPAYSTTTTVVDAEGLTHEVYVYNDDARELIETVAREWMAADGEREGKRARRYRCDGYTGPRYRPAEAARELGLSYQRIGKLVSDLGLRGDPKMTVQRVGKNDRYDLTRAGFAALRGAVRGGTGAN